MSGWGSAGWRGEGCIRGERTARGLCAATVLGQSMGERERKSEN